MQEPFKKDLQNFTEWYKTLLNYLPTWEKTCRTI